MYRCYWTQKGNWFLCDTVFLEPRNTGAQLRVLPQDKYLRRGITIKLVSLQITEKFIQSHFADVGLTAGGVTISGCNTKGGRVDGLQIRTNPRSARDSRDHSVVGASR